MASDREVLITVRVGSIDWGNLKGDLAELEKNVIKIPIKADIDSGTIKTDISKALSSIKAGDLNKDIRLEIDNASWQKDLSRAEATASKTAKEINADFDKALRNAGSSTTLRNRLLGEDGLNPTADELDVFIRDYTNALDKLASVQFDTSNITAGFDESDLYNYAEALQEVCNYLEVMNESQIDFTKYGIEDATWDLEDYNQQLQELRASAPEIVNEIGTQNVEQLNAQMEKVYESIVNIIGSMDGFSLDQLAEGLIAQTKAAEEQINSLKNKLKETQDELNNRPDVTQGEFDVYVEELNYFEEELVKAENKLNEFGKAGFDTSSQKAIAQQLAGIIGVTQDIDKVTTSVNELQGAINGTGGGGGSGTGTGIGTGTGGLGGFGTEEDFQKLLDIIQQVQYAINNLQLAFGTIDENGNFDSYIDSMNSEIGWISDSIDQLINKFEDLQKSLESGLFSKISTGENGIGNVFADQEQGIEHLNAKLEELKNTADDTSVDTHNILGTLGEESATSIFGEYDSYIKSIRDMLSDTEELGKGYQIDTEQFQVLLDLISQISDALVTMQSALGSVDENGEFQSYIASIQAALQGLQDIHIDVSQFDIIIQKLQEIAEASKTLQDSITTGVSGETTQGSQACLDSLQNIQTSIQTLSSSLDVAGFTEAINGMAESLGNLQNAFGTVSDGGEFQPYLAQIQDMVSGINELKEAMSGLDFNIKINMRNPIQENAEYGQAARQTIEELKQAFNELNLLTKNSGSFPAGSDFFNDLYEADKLTSGSLANQISGYETLIKDLQELAEYNNIDISSWTEKYNASLTQSLENLDKLRSGEKQTEESMNQLQSLFGGTNNVDFSGMVDQLQQILEIIQQISDKLGEGFDFSKLFGEGDASISTLLEPLQRIPDMLDQINQQLSGGLKFGTVEDTSSIDNFIASMERIPDTLDKVNAKLNGGLKINNVSDKAFASFETSLENLSSSSESLGDKVDDVELYVDALRTLSSIDLSGLASNLKDVGDVKGINQVTKTMQQQSNQFQKEQESRINSSIKAYMKAGGNESDSAVQDARALLEVLDTEFSTLGLSGKSSIDEITSSMGEFSKQTQDVISNLNQMTAELNRRGTTEQQTANLEKQYSSALTTLEKLENKLVSGKDLTVRESSQLEQARAQIEEINQMTDEVGQQVADKFSDQFNQITQNYQTSIGELLDTSISEATASLDTSVEGLGSFDEIKTDLNELTELKQHFLELKPGEMFSDEDVKRTNELRSAVKELSNDLTPITNRQGTYQGVLSSTDVSGRVNELKEYIKAQNEASDATVEFNKVTKDGSGLSYTITDKSAGTVQQWTASIDQATGSFRTYMNTESQYITVSDRMMASLKSKMTTLTSYLTVMMSFQRVFSIIKDGMNTIKEIDSAMKQLEIVTGASNDELTQFLENSIDLSKELGQDVSEVVDTITVFSRLGYNLEDASELAEYSAILSNVADVEISDATTGLTSAIKGFDLAVEDSEHVADVLITVGQNYAVSASEILEAFEKSSAAMAATDTSFEQAAAIIAAGNAAVQDASTVGTALKTKLYCLCVQKCAYRTYLIAGNA